MAWSILLACTVLVLEVAGFLQNRNRGPTRPSVDIFFEPTLEHSGLGRLDGSSSEAHSDTVDQEMVFQPEATGKLMEHSVLTTAEQLEEASRDLAASILRYSLLYNRLSEELELKKSSTAVSTESLNFFHRDITWWSSTECSTDGRFVYDPLFSSRNQERE